MGFQVNTIEIIKTESGSGYKVNDILPLDDGSGVAAQIKVTVLGTNNCISQFVIVDRGNYTALPPNLNRVGVPAGTVGSNTQKAYFKVTMLKSPPSISVIAENDIINYAKSRNDLTISGTTEGVDDGARIEIQINNKLYYGTVTNNQWTAVISATTLQSLKASSYKVGAAVPNVTMSSLRTINCDVVQSTISINPIYSDDKIGITESNTDCTITGSSTGIEDNQNVTVTLKDKNYTGKVTKNSWKVIVPATDIISLPDAVQSTVTVTASDISGNSASATRSIIPYMKNSPVITINSVTGDDRVNVAECQSNIAINGTITSYYEFLIPKISFNGVNYIPIITITSGTGVFPVQANWSITVPPGVSKLLPTGKTYTVNAEIFDIGGNKSTASRPVSVSNVAPNITIGTICGDDKINITESNSDVTLSGTTKLIELNQDITVTLNNKTYTCKSNSATGWSVVVPSNDIKEIADSKTVIILAEVYDLSGNKASASKNIIVGTHSSPTISINVIAGDDSLNVDKTNVDLTITGSTTNVENGLLVNVTLDGKSFAGSVQNNEWKAIIPKSYLKKLTDNAYSTFGAIVNDVAGNPANTSRNVFVSLTVPVITINDVSTDNRLNLSDFSNDLIITGTTGTILAGSTTPIKGIEDGQQVTVNVGVSRKSYTGYVGTNTWNVTIPSSDLNELFPDGKSAVINAMVYSLRGNKGITSKTISVDKTVPTSTMVFTVSGTTTSCEENQPVVLTINGKNYNTKVSKNNWSIIIPLSDVLLLGSSGNPFASLQITDLSGNILSKDTNTVPTPIAPGTGGSGIPPGP